MEIPNWPISGERERELLMQVLDSTAWGGYHEFVPKFAQAFAEFQHCRFGVPQVNGTVTLETALHVAGIGPGDEVIVPAISFISTATAVSRTGATPVFVDIESNTFNMDMDRAAAAIGARTKAIIVVHFGGPLADVERATRIAADRGLVLIEDAAHAHGSEWLGRRAGSFGLAASFSFQNSKVMTCGEGGMLTTNDEAFAVHAASFGDQGRQRGRGWFHHYTLGTNYRMTALQAAVLIAQLERLPEQIRLRRCNAQILRAETAEAPGLEWQQVRPEVTANSYYLLLGRIDARRFGMTRDAFHQALTARGIPCTPFYPHPLYGNPLYEDGGCRVEPCPIAEACIGDAFWIPHRALMGSPETTREIAAAIVDLGSRS